MGNTQPVLQAQFQMPNKEKLYIIGTSLPNYEFDIGV